MDLLLERGIVEPPSIDADLERLQREPTAARQLEVRVGQLMDGPRAVGAETTSSRGVRLRDPNSWPHRNRASSR